MEKGVSPFFMLISYLFYACLYTWGEFLLPFCQCPSNPHSFVIFWEKVFVCFFLSIVFSITFNIAVNCMNSKSKVENL